MRKAIVLCILLLGLVATGCGASSENNDDAGPAGATGGTATGGGSGGATGGRPGLGGALSTGGTGGANPASGGVAGTGAGGTGGGATGGTAGGNSGGGIAGRGGGSSTGGAVGTGGTAGTTATGGTGGAGGMASDCGIEPVTPHATQKTRKALCYLYKMYGNHILAGQEENNDNNGMSYIYANTGKYPAIRAFDVNNSMAPSQCVADGKSHGLCMFGYHMGIVSGDGYQSSQMKTDINTVLTEGTSYNQTFKARLDNVARMVKTVQDADGVAIMRLFHEAGGTWFWWSMESGAQYVRVYKYAFNYLTTTKGLTNMIWLLPYDGNPNASFYPGKSFVDLGGADTYAGDGKYDAQNSLYQKCVAIFGAIMPIALHECGPIPDPAQLMSTGAKWLFFNVWTSPYYQAPSNSLSHLQSVYSSNYVITRDEMPEL